MARQQKAESTLPSQLVFIKEQPVKPSSAVGSALCFEMKEANILMRKIRIKEQELVNESFVPVP